MIRNGGEQIADRLIKRNSGVFLAEMRLWSIYIAMPFFIVGMCLLGWAYEEKPSIVAVIFGWGMAEYARRFIQLCFPRSAPDANASARFGILILTVATYNYLGNTFPQQQGEVSAMINLARTIGGFGKSTKSRPSPAPRPKLILLPSPSHSVLPSPLVALRRTEARLWHGSGRRRWPLYLGHHPPPDLRTTPPEPLCVSPYSYQPRIPLIVNTRKSCLYSYLCRVCMHSIFIATFSSRDESLSKLESP